MNIVLNIAMEKSTVTQCTQHGYLAFALHDNDVLPYSFIPGSSYFMLGGHRIYILLNTEILLKQPCNDRKK